MATVLVVEDEKNIRQFIVVNLKVRGYNVIQAPSAEHGLEHLRECRDQQSPAPDVLLLDIKLPGMSGWELLKILADDSTLPRLPVIIMSASPSNNQAEEYYYDQIVARLTKPVSAGQLVSTVSHLFEKQG